MTKNQIINGYFYLATMEQTVNDKITQAIQQFESLSKKSEAEMSRVISDVQNEFGRLRNLQAEDRRQMFDQIHAESRFVLNRSLLAIISFFF